MVKKVLVVYAHPSYQNARINSAIIAQLEKLEFVTVHNLYSSYPDEKLNIKLEQKLLVEHDLIVLQFPFYWYSVTPLMKKWIDEVWDMGFAYGDQGDKLHGKSLLICTTTSGNADMYSVDKLGITLVELLKPLEYTAKFCGLIYRPPILIANPHTEVDKLSKQIEIYVNLLKSFISKGESAFDSVW